MAGLQGPASHQPFVTPAHRQGPRSASELAGSRAAQRWSLPAARTTNMIERRRFAGGTPRRRQPKQHRSAGLTRRVELQVARRRGLAPPQAGWHPRALRSTPKLMAGHFEGVDPVMPLANARCDLLS